MRSRKAELYLLEGRKMPPAAGAQPRTPDLENNDACWRAKPRANRRRFFPKRGFKGAQPLWPPEGILPLCFLTFTRLSLVADDCKKLLVRSMNAFLNPFATGARPWTKTPSSSGTCSKPATPKARARASRNLDAQEKAELYLLREGRKMPPAARGAQPPDPRPGKQ